MKLLKKLLAIMLALSCVFAITACDKESEEELDTTKHGIALEYEIEEEDDESYVVITGLFLSDGEKYSINEEDYETIDLVIGADGKITVPTYDEDENPVYDENDNLVTEEISLGEEHKGFKIADAAFASQVIIGSVVIDASVVEIGATAFAGCTGIEKMELPYVGKVAEGAVNANKLFASIFGTAETTGCTSVTCSYNASGSATYYVPNALKEVTVNYAEGSVLPAYAFNGVTTLETITVNGVTEIGASAFAGCSGAYTVSLPANVTVIGKSAFSGCAKLINFAFPTELTTIFQEAFSGCVRLGYGKNTVVELAKVTTIHEKAFNGCTSISAINLPAVENIGIAAFYNCSSLKSATIKAGAVIGNDAFEGCHEDLAI